MVNLKAQCKVHTGQRRRLRLHSGASITNTSILDTFWSLSCVLSYFLKCYFDCGSFASIDIVLVEKKKKRILPCMIFLSDNSYELIHVPQLIWLMFVLSWEKPKWVHLDVICIHTLVFCSTFWTGWDFKKYMTKTQAFQFLQLVVHMYFVPVELFILEIKERNLYWKKIVWPLNVAWPWLGLEFGLLVVRSNFGY